MNHSKRRKNQRKRHMLPKQKFAKLTRPEAGILSRVADALRIAEFLPIVVLPHPSSMGLLRHLLEARNQ
jgi:hypothetical protein